MLIVLNEEKVVEEALILMMSDACLAEISSINMKVGPLVDFPADINENVYVSVVNYGLDHCPKLMHFLLNMVVRRGDPVLPSHVLKTATLYSSVCYAANHELSAITKLRSLTLQVDGLSNLGLDTLSDLGLTQCARSLSNHRDLFAEVGPQVIDSTAALCPYQSTIDNCDYLREHLTIETIEKEVIDTSHLNTSKLSKDEALAMFTKELILLGSEANQEERDHLLSVIAQVTAKVLVKTRPSAHVFAKHLPRHHQHENAEKKLVPAITFIVKPYPYQVIVMLKV